MPHATTPFRTTGAHLAIVETDHDPLGPDRPAEQALFVVERGHADEAAARDVHHELVRRFEFGFGAGEEEVERERFAAGGATRISGLSVARRMQSAAKLLGVLLES